MPPTERVITLVQLNMLMGGEPRHGKQVPQELIAAYRATPADCQLVLIDGKRAVPSWEWACRHCGDAYFSEPPDTGLCTSCQQQHDNDLDHDAEGGSQP